MGRVCRDLQEVRLHEEVQRLVPDLDKPTDVRVQQHHSFPGKPCIICASIPPFGVRLQLGFPSGPCSTPLSLVGAGLLARHLPASKCCCVVLQVEREKERERESLTCSSGTVLALLSSAEPGSRQGQQDAASVEQMEMHAASL